MIREDLNCLELIIKKEYSNIAGIGINKDGGNIYEQYFNSCDSESTLHVYSVTKSLISILIGIIIDKGYIEDLDQKVIDFFPEYKSIAHNRSIDIITLRNLLTMTCPFKYGLMPPYIKYFTSDDWVDFSLNILGGRGKIGQFKYTPLIGPDILSGILKQVTGKSVLELANEYLFTPLGIRHKEKVVFETKDDQINFNNSTNINGWVADSKGTNSAGWGLTLSVQDMLKIGQLIMNKGVYKSKTIISENWISMLTSVHSKWKKHNLSYGLLWWIIDEEKGIYAAKGDGGNIIYVNKEKDLVVSINSLFRHRTKDRIKFIQNYIEKIL